MSVTSEQAMSPRRFFSRKKMYLVRPLFRILICLTLSFGFCLLTVMASSAAQSNRSFEYKDAVEEARLLAQKPFEEPKKLPEFLFKINYDQWRSIRFKPEEALWRNDKMRFEAQFFHPGFFYNRTVSINVVESGESKSVPFSPDLFHYGMNEFKDKVPQDLGFSGFRLHHPINTGKYYDEVIVFLGASYFRAVGREQNFGLGGRGVAIDTGMESGEEFPYFRKFWLVRPQEKAETITIFALLDSPSLTGAYQFGIQPGKATLIDVTTTLFLRKEVKKLGIAPLNSMFFYGENTNIRPVNDFRPEVHDSDGLQIATATGEWIWRPLINPKRLLVTSFQLKNPKGFGLFQRDTDFDQYQDLEADYQMRPCAWIIPKNDWGEGRVELVQIPTDSEKNENVVSYWVPASLPKPGSSMSISYQMKWGSPDIARPPLARVVATRTGTIEGKEGKMYLIDFQGEKPSSPSKDAKVEADIGVGDGDVTEQHIEKHRFSDGWRLVFQVKKKEGPLVRVTPGNQPLELRAFLRQGDAVLTETWTYVDPF
jgi:periplasmic glucans biosynthesis protein